ncbi:MAG: hypothetical protein E7679_07340 [Ruminococcaceae bacterium]|nr:hypothetical protein [Oscillospiraceae bacterium]
MCRICGKYICPPSCPSYDGESAEMGKMIGRCSECGVRLCEYDDIVYSYGKPYCVDCYNIKIRYDERYKYKRRGNEGKSR